MCMLRQHEHHDARHEGSSDQVAKPWYMTPLGVIGLGLAVLVAVYLWVYHNQHVLALLPFAVLLLCPLMHLFGHGRHSHGHR